MIRVRPYSSSKPEVSCQCSSGKLRARLQLRTRHDGALGEVAGEEVVVDLRGSKGRGRIIWSAGLKRRGMQNQQQQAVSCGRDLATERLPTHNAPRRLPRREMGRKGAHRDALVSHGVLAVLPLQHAVHQQEGVPRRAGQTERRRLSAWRRCARAIGSSNGTAASVAVQLAGMVLLTLVSQDARKVQQQQHAGKPVQMLCCRCQADRKLTAGLTSCSISTFTPAPPLSPVRQDAHDLLDLLHSGAMGLAALQPRLGWRCGSKATGLSAAAAKRSEAPRRHLGPCAAMRTQSRACSP